MRRKSSSSLLQDVSMWSVTFPWVVVMLRFRMRVLIVGFLGVMSIDDDDLIIFLFSFFYSSIIGLESSRYLSFMVSKDSFLLGSVF